MLIIRCSGCRTKLFKYEKIGKGAVLRCYKSRIHKAFAGNIIDGKFQCECGQVIGVDKGAFFRMIKKAFTYSGTKL